MGGLSWVVWVELTSLPVCLQVKGQERTSVPVMWCEEDSATAVGCEDTRGHEPGGAGFLEAGKDKERLLP